MVERFQKVSRGAQTGRLDLDFGSHRASESCNTRGNVGAVRRVSDRAKGIRVSRSGIRLHRAGRYAAPLAVSVRPVTRSRFPRGRGVTQKQLLCRLRSHKVIARIIKLFISYLLSGAVVLSLPLQSPVMVLKEPRHHVKFENEYVRVIDASARPESR